MFQRVTALFLIPPLLFQGACFAHGHSDGVPEPTGHDETPHFHLGAPGHHHHHEDGTHRHDDEDQDAEGAAGFRQDPEQDHDDDAIYLPASVLIFLRGRQPQAGSGELSALVRMAGMVSLPLPVLASHPRWTHPPPLLPCSRCPIYLWTLTLLI